MPLPAWDAEDVDESGGQGNHGGRKAQLTLWSTYMHSAGDHDPLYIKREGLQPN